MINYTVNKNSMEAVLMAYNGKELASLRDESTLNLAWLTRRVLAIIDENIYCFKSGSWNIRNRLNKLLIDDERSNCTLLNIRVGRKQIARYMFPQLRDMEKVALLEDLKRQVASHQFDEKFSAFLEEELKRAEDKKLQRKNAKKTEKQAFQYATAPLY